MIDFILAGVVNIAVMLVVVLCISFITIAISYSVAACIRWWSRFRQVVGYADLSSPRL